MSPFDPGEERGRADSDRVLMTASWIVSDDQEIGAGVATPVRRQVPEELRLALGTSAVLLLVQADEVTPCAARLSAAGPTSSR